ncbi:MAG: hypothetical protein IKJ91_09225 [Clostridia bacterium]|nr:hypothetical protein [Clostridia bacterium]
MTKYIFNGKAYNNYDNVAKAVYEYAEQHIDDYLDSKSDVSILGRNYRLSYVLKLVDIGYFKTMMVKYAGLLFDKYVEEINVEDMYVA